MLPETEQLAFHGHDRGHPQRQRQLGRLGRLEGDAAEVNPVLVAVDFVTDQLDQDQEDKGRAQHRPGQPLEPDHVDAREDEHGENADGGEHALLEGVTVGRLSGGDGFDAGGREHHHDADGGQGQRGAQDEVVRGAVPGRARFLPGRTRRRGTSPGSARGRLARGSRPRVCTLGLRGAGLERR